MRTLFVLLFSLVGFVRCFNDDLWNEIKVDAEEDWKSLKEGLTNGFEKVEKGLEEEWEAVKDVANEDWNAVKEAAKEDWELAKEGTKEGWKTVKEEAEKDWDKMDLDWNKRPLSDSEESKESHEVESKDEQMVTEDYIDEFEKNLNKESEEDFIVTEDASETKCVKLCFIRQSSEVKETSGQEECEKGCKSQKREFKSMQEKFQNTEPSLLLGSSLDHCWEGCENVPQCIDGCNIMRTLQITQLNEAKEQAALTDLAAKEVEVEKKETEFNKEVADKEQELSITGKDRKESDFVLETSAGDGIEKPHVWTYVLWRPSFSADGLPSLTQEDARESYAQMVRLIKKLMGCWEMPDDQVFELPGGQQQRGGWRDDRMQLKIPEETAAAAMARSEGDGSFYSQLTQSLGNVREQVQNTFRAPGFQQDLYYILIGLSGFLLITTALNSVFSRREQQPIVEDHYFLNGKTAGAKLPTYEDCIKADRELVMDITNQEDYTKKNLALPTFVVLEPLAATQISEPASVHATNNKQEEGDEGNVA